MGDSTYTRDQKVSRAVLEYMEHRKTYDAACGETEKTTFMRDVMTQVVAKLCDEEDVMDFEEDPAGGSSPDRLYFNKVCEKNEGNCLMLAYPNTRAADLFSMQQTVAAAKIMRKDTASVNVHLTPPEHRERIFAAFRKLHWRIVRQVGESGYAKYGVDEGLREEDCDKRFMSFKGQHAKHHKELLSEKWCLRDWLGFDSKRLHSNESLVKVVFSEWLGLDEKLVGKVQKQAEKLVKAAAKKVAKKQKSLKKSLKEGCRREPACGGFLNIVGARAFHYHRLIGDFPSDRAPDAHESLTERTPCRRLYSSSSAIGYHFCKFKVPVFVACARLA